MTEEQENIARRFMHLVDALYDHNVKLIITAETMPQDLYHGRTHAKSFERTVSRLVEMDTPNYLALPHSPVALETA
jgi:cell division protein ZapE